MGESLKGVLKQTHTNVKKTKENAVIILVMNLSVAHTWNAAMKNGKLLCDLTAQKWLQKTQHVSYFDGIWLHLVILISRLEDPSAWKAAPLRTLCRAGRLLRQEGVAVSCGLAEVCVWDWELSPERLRSRPRAEDLVKVRGQHNSSASRSNLSPQQLIRKTRIIQVN